MMQLERIPMVFRDETLIDHYRRQNANRRTRLKRLTYAKNIVKYSFLCHKSITYLDLSLQEYSSYKKTIPPGEICFHNYICTEQGLQKFLRPLKECKRMILLQNYHLDTIKELEPVKENVEYNTVNPYRIYDCDIVYNVVPAEYFYVCSIYRYIMTAIGKNTDKLSIIKLCLKLMKHKDFHFYVSKPGTKGKFISFMIESCSDFELLFNVLKMISFDIWIIYDSKPDQLECFLSRAHAFKEGRNVVEKDLIYMAFANCMYKNVEILLKYQSFPKLSSRSYQCAYRSLISARKKVDYAELKNFFNPTVRKLQAILTFLAFMEKTDSAFQNLQLLWRSLPMCFITLDEFEYLFGPMLKPAEIKEIYNFYTDIIEQHSFSCQPRMLKHYCRLKIRNVLHEQQHLHDGIDQLGFPLDLQLYLKLKK